MKRPWLKFYPADWRADPALRMCSIGARGLWMEMLCLMHEAVPYGALLVKGAPVSERQLAGLAGISLRETALLLAELAAAGVFSRDDDGTIFSRRMRRDAERAERDKANGREGGNPNLKRGVNPQDNGEVNGEVNGEDKAQSPEARLQSPESKTEDRAVAGATRTRWSDEFENGFWRPYPRTPVMSKAEAWKAWQKSSEADRAMIVAAIPRYAAWLRSKPDHPAVHACRFITQRRFEGFAEPEPEPEPAPDLAGKFYARCESDELLAWDRHMQATGGRGLPRDRAGGWLVASRWPPGDPRGTP